LTNHKTKATNDSPKDAGSHKQGDDMLTGYANYEQSKSKQRQMKRYSSNTKTRKVTLSLPQALYDDFIRKCKDEKPESVLELMVFNFISETTNPH
jgi:hypothetical protein